MKINIQRLTSVTADPFARMTYGRYKPSVRLPELMRHKTIALGLFVNDVPAGLVLAQARLRDLRIDASCELLSIFVEAEHRRQGFALRLLQHLADEARSEGFSRIMTRYSAETPKTALLGDLFNAAGFSAPETAVYRCEMNAIDVVKAPILNHTRLPANYHTRLWNELSAAEHKHIFKCIEDQPSYDIRMMPDQKNFPIEPRCSLVLQCGDTIAGWFIARTIDPSTLEYSSLFVAPEHRHSRTVVALIARAVNTQVRTPLRETYTHGRFIVMAENPRWRDSLLRSFSPYSDAVTHHGIMQINRLS
jgi:GNAT superfamily N-acetyltransferase